MEFKKIAVMFILVCVGLSPTAGRGAQLCDSNIDCTSPDECVGGACVPPVPDPDAYVTDAMTRWSSYAWAVQFPALFEPTAEICCFDYTGDTFPDDAFGNLLVLLASLPGTGDPVAMVDSALANGDLVKIFDWRELAPDLVSGDVQLSVFEGMWTDATTHADRIVGQGHVAFRRSSFGPFGAIDQLNDGTVTAALVELTGNQFTLLLPSVSFGASAGMTPIHLQMPRLEAPVAHDPGPCLGLCSVDEDRGAGHTPQIVGGARLGGVMTADEVLTNMDAFYRQCACAGIVPSLPVLNWYENPGGGSFVIECTANTGDPSLCDPDDPCADLDTTCSFIPLMATSFDVDLDGTGINDSWSVGLRVGFAGTTLDAMPELFADGFESGDLGAWSSSSP